MTRDEKLKKISSLLKKVGEAQDEIAEVVAILQDGDEEGRAKVKQMIKDIDELHVGIQQAIAKLEV